MRHESCSGAWLLLVATGLLGPPLPAQDEPPEQRGAQPLAQEIAPAAADYAARHAVIIGIDEYKDPGFRRLRFAVNDAMAFREVLVEKYGFPEGNVRLLLNEEATKAAISHAIEDWIAEPGRVGKDDLVVVYFAGHGMTRTSAGSEPGYLVPFDATTGKMGPVWSTLYAMWELGGNSNLIPANHVVYILDCCFGGLATRGGAPPAAADLLRKARQILTAGTEEQTVSDEGDEGHSVFTGALLRGLKGAADDNHNEVITFWELYEYVRREVRSMSSGKQEPIQGTFHDGGGCVTFYPPGWRPGENVHEKVLRQAAEIEQLDDLQTLRNLAEGLRQLWPRGSELVPEYGKWLGHARDLLNRLPAHEQSLQRTEQETLPRKVEAGDLSQGDDSEIRWDAVDPQLRRRHERLSELVEGVRKLPEAIADIEQRLSVAESIQQRTIDERASEWEQAIEAIAESPAYGDLEIEPQVGLVPLKADPDSGLFEFWLWETGEAPIRDPRTGKIVPTEGMGVVLVLLPGGETSVGSKPLSDPKDAHQPYIDPDSESDERPVYSVKLEPFFISKYEVTQSQWTRVLGHGPSERTTDGNAGAHPAQSISWDDCAEFLRRLALDFPTEAQWEYACRAGTCTVFWTGDFYRSLQGCANIADASWLEAGGEPRMPHTPEVRDGYASLAPVGVFLPNGFGLHDMHGNVWEWCRDLFTMNRPRDGDGLREGSDSSYDHSIRGGSWFGDARNARAANRFNYGGGSRDSDLGLRPLRLLAR
ncbi:MAG: SUMF1/EgtB/PvdO family nonheme iron enzyme [Planctomycetota bacterium]